MKHRMHFTSLSFPHALLASLWLTACEGQVDLGNNTPKDDQGEAGAASVTSGSGGGDSGSGPSSGGAGGQNGSTTSNTGGTKGNGNTGSGGVGGDAVDPVTSSDGSGGSVSTGGLGGFGGSAGAPPIGSGATLVWENNGHHLPNIYNVEADSTHLYAMVEFEIYRVKIADELQQGDEVASFGSLSPLVVHDQHLFTCQPEGMRRRSKLGGGYDELAWPQATPDEEQSCNNLVVNGEFVYANRPNEDESGFYLVRAPLDTFDDLETVAELPPHDIAVASEDAVYFVRSDQMPVVIGRYSFDEQNTAEFHIVEPNYSSERLSLLSATREHLYYQRCETQSSFCTLFRVPVGGGSATAYEHLTRRDWISALAAHGNVVFLGVDDKLLRVDTPQDVPVEFWTAHTEDPWISHILLTDSGHLVWTQREQLWTFPLD